MDWRNWTPLHFAVNSGYNTIAKKLLKHGADLNIKNDEGETPLEMAITGWPEAKVNFSDKLYMAKK